MDSFAISSNLALYQSTESQLTREQLLDIIERESRQKYPHLHVRFYPDRYMQAKIRIETGSRRSLLEDTPTALIDLLASEHFIPQEFTDYLPQRDSKLDAPQYVLVNRELARIGYKFVMKAAIGPGFISFWFRNESDSTRLDLPVFYALEILNKLHHKISVIENFHPRATANTGDANSLLPDSERHIGAHNR